MTARVPDGEQPVGGERVERIVEAISTGGLSLVARPTEPSAAPVAADDELREAIQQRQERAWQEVAGLCDGSRRWTMRVPVDPDRDSDEVIGAALRDVDVLLAELEALRAENAELRAKVARARAWADMNDDMARQYDEAAAAVTTPHLIAEASVHAEDCRAVAEGLRRALDGTA